MSARRNRSTRSSSGSSENRSFLIANVERDSGDDGRTDLEERALGLNPFSRDSDADGIEDAADRSPQFRPVSHEDEEALILQRAVFAAFGLTDSPWALFARDANVRPIQTWGLPAPVLFNRPLSMPDLTAPVPGGVFVSWRIVHRTTTEATVEITDREGPLAAAGQEIFLRRVNGIWVVVGRQTTWIS